MADFENEWGIVGAGQNSNPKVTGIFSDFGPDSNFQLVQLGIIIPVKNKK